MRIVFLGNYFSHHQKPLSDALAKKNSYHFIATAQLPEERRALGWGQDREPEYIIHYDLEPERADAMIARADVVIAGSAPEYLVRRCILRGQLVFRYSERPLKNGLELKKYLPRLLKWHWRNPPGKKVYLLCASGFTAGDYTRFGLFRNRAYRWGYFPETKEYEDFGKLMDGKKKASILWVGRFLDWKHPDDAVAVAAALKASGYRFELSLIGGGPMEQTLRDMIREKELDDSVRLLGTMTPEMVRRHMEESEIFLFTSDRKEGWGAVLNEAMNSGCCVVACEAAGSVPYLVSNGRNGLTYRFGDEDGLYEQVRKALDTEGMTTRLGAKAYETMANHWNGETAAERLVALVRSVLAGEKYPDLYPDGPCSKESEQKWG